MLAAYLRQICVCSILITLSGDVEKNPRPKPSSCDNISICHGNLSSISAYNFLLCGYILIHIFHILCLSES